MSANDFTTIRHVVGRVGQPGRTGRPPWARETLAEVFEALKDVTTIDINDGDLVGTFRILRLLWDGEELAMLLRKRDDWRRLVCVECKGTGGTVGPCFSCGHPVCMACGPEHKDEKHGDVAEWEEDEVIYDAERDDPHPGAGRGDDERCPFCFKDAQCGYEGPADDCDKTLENCRSHGNEERFGGFPNMDDEYADARNNPLPPCDKCGRQALLIPWPWPQDHGDEGPRALYCAYCHPGYDPARDLAPNARCISTEEELEAGMKPPLDLGGPVGFVDAENALVGGPGKPVNAYFYDAGLKPAFVRVRIEGGELPPLVRRWQVWMTKEGETQLMRNGVDPDDLFRLESAEGEGLHYYPVEEDGLTTEEYSNQPPTHLVVQEQRVVCRDCRRVTENARLACCTVCSAPVCKDCAVAHALDHRRRA